jgi:hypothetical protein
MHSDQVINSIRPLERIVSRSRYEWADVMLMPINPSVLRIARATEQALTELGISCGYLWSTLPSDARKIWEKDTSFAEWTEMILPVSWYANTLNYTFQMLRGLREVLSNDLCRKFGVFATFIDSGWSPRLLTLACERQGIPNVLIQEGMTIQHRKVNPPRTVRSIAGRIVRRLRVLAAPRLFDYVEDGMHMQYACVYGPLQAESLIARGKPRENIIITGNPLFDTAIPKRIDAQPRSRTILYAHQTLSQDLDTEIAWWRALVKASLDIGANLIFKIHPRSVLSVAQIRDILGICDDASVTFISNGDIQDMVAEVGVFVTACSTSAYRAMVEGVPIIVLEGLPTMYRFDLPDYGAALSVHQPGELPRVLQLALEDPQVRVGLQKGVNTAIERHLYRLDGQASRRVALALASLLR